MFYFLFMQNANNTISLTDFIYKENIIFYSDMYYRIGFREIARRELIHRCKSADRIPEACNLSEACISNGFVHAGISEVSREF